MAAFGGEYTSESLIIFYVAHVEFYVAHVEFFKTVHVEFYVTHVENNKYGTRLVVHTCGKTTDSKKGDKQTRESIL